MIQIIWLRNYRNIIPNYQTALGYGDDDITAIQADFDRLVGLAKTFQGAAQSFAQSVTSHIRLIQNGTGNPLVALPALPSLPASPQTTTTLYDLHGRPLKTLLSNGTSTINTYHATGERQRTSGSRTYPVEYAYDHAGRMKTLKTWRNFASDAGAALTTWNYSAQRGFLVAKQYADAQGPTYTYTAAGRLATRTWARGITTYYAYNNAGDLASVNYDDNLTPGVTHTYDRRGRPLTRSAGVSPASTLTYNPAGQITSETLATGLTVTNTYDSLLRRSGLAALSPSSQTLSAAAYTYDSASRLESVSDGTNTATYTYVANSPLVSQIAFTQSGQPRMTTTKQYDSLNRLTSIASGAPNSNSALSSFAYDYNSANQRTRTTHADASYWIYQYDTLGQVTSGKRFWADGTPVAGQQFEYGFDDIGNRQTAAHGGNAGGSNLRVETYTANDLNQYTQRTVPGFAEVQGRARSDATVTVNLQATTRQGPYWRSELITDNSITAVRLGITNVAVLRGGGTGGTDLVASNTGTLFLPQTPETYLHDPDGNLTRDGRWTNSWDAENRLIRTESLASTPASARVRQDWSHLPDGRWAQRIIYFWTNDDWVPQATNRFLWDGQVLLAVLNGANQPEQTYLRGLDLSGTPQGAGGVGGLLAVNLGTNGTHFACFDGNGNVSALISADTAAETARYEYDSFGNTLRATGPVADANSLRFSTQFTDDLTRRVKYLYRDYDARMGRWMSRDPIAEDGGLNFYAPIGNDLIFSVDYLGLWKIERKGDPRAIAYAETDDTIVGLAKKIKLNEDEWPQWLKEKFVYTKPYDKNTELTACDSFTIPNTAYIDGADYLYLLTWKRLHDYENKVKKQWVADGYYVVKTAPALVSAGSMTTHLDDPNIYAYLYIGHGRYGAAYPHESSTLGSGRHTRFGISDFRLIACYNQANHPDWGKNVSKLGILTIPGVDLYNGNESDLRTFNGE